MTKHSRTIGGSSAGRVLACPASYELCKTMPEEPTSPYAAEGTALHQVMEYCLMNGLSPLAPAPQGNNGADGAFTPSLIGEEFYGHTITQEHIDTCIDPALRMFDKIYDELDKDPGGVTYKLEQRVEFPGIPEAFGTLDVIMTTSERTVVLDWKFGGGVPVSAYENAQMMFYACGLEVDDLKAGAELVIIQPRVNEAEVSRWQASFEQLYYFRDGLILAFSKATSPNPPYERGDHCRFCRAKPICPMYKDVGEKLQALVIAGTSPGNGGLFTPDILAEWMETAAIVTDWAKSVTKLAYSEAEAGRPPKGKKLIQKLANTSWVSEDPKAIDRMLARKGLGLDERRKPWENVSPTVAKKELKKIDKKLKDRDTQRLSGKTVLVDEDDPRPAVLNNDQKAVEAGAALKELTNG